MSRTFQLISLGEDPNAPFPSTHQALDSPNGLLAWGGDLRPERLQNAYRKGIFPWYSEGQPILWWSPAPRCVLYPQDVYVSRRTRRRFNSGKFRLSADTAFDDVIRACAEPRGDDEGTWITDYMISAYIRLHELGHAHSVEVWEENCLVGGIYGLALGSVFFGESMFSRQTDASKIALISLCGHLQQNGFGFMDCQVGNPHLFSMGATELVRQDFEQQLQRLLAKKQKSGSWSNTFQPAQCFPST